MKDNWQYKKLGEVCEIISGQDYKSVQDDKGKYPIYGSGGRMGLANQYRCKENTIIIGRKGNINNPIFVEEKFWNVDTAFGILPKSTILIPKFFYFFSKNYDFTKHDVSVTIPSLRRKDLLTILIPVPPLSEQERIVAELDLLSEIIEKQKQQLKELDTLSQSIFYSMFGDPITNDKNWEIKKLGEVTIIPNKLEKKQINSDLLVSFLPMEDVKIDSIYQIPKQSKKLSELTKGSYNYFSNQDVLLAKVTPCFENGKCCIVKDLINQIGFGSSELIAFRCQESILPIYLYFYFHSPTFISNGIKNMSGTSGLRRIQKNYLQKVSISIPPISLQNSFAEKIEKMEKQKEAINKSIEETQKLFDFTIDKYFG